MADRCDDLPGQPPDERPPRLLRRHALRLDDGSVVLVQRGWLPRDLIDRTRIAAAPPTAGRVFVQGRIAPAPGRLYEFETAASGPIRQNLDLDGYARETGLPLRPLTLVQEDGRRRHPTGCCASGPAPPPTCTSTTAMPFNGSP
jgi:surfeit locus 1 family protein